MTEKDKSQATTLSNWISLNGIHETVQRIFHCSIHFCSSSFHSANDQFMCTLQRSDADIGALYMACVCVCEMQKLHEYQSCYKVVQLKYSMFIILCNIFKRLEEKKLKVSMLKALENNKFCANIFSSILNFKIDRRTNK